MVFANTDEEAKVIKRVHQVAESKIHVGAAGIEVKPTLFQKSDPSSTVLFFAGRVGPSKGLDTLISMLTRINQGRERPYILRLAGRMEEGFKLPRLGWIQYLGHISQELFDQQLRECLAVINPSEFESLSLLALEALASGTPVVLNSKCAVLKQYCEATPLAIGYSTELELKSCLSEAENIRKKEDYFRELQCKTALWIDEHLSWNPVVGRLLQQLKFN